jgi:hypothetical protein
MTGHSTSQYSWERDSYLLLVEIHWFPVENGRDFIRCKIDWKLIPVSYWGIDLPWYFMGMYSNINHAGSFYGGHSFCLYCWSCRFWLLRRWCSFTNHYSRPVFRIFPLTWLWQWRASTSGENKNSILFRIVGNKHPGLPGVYCVTRQTTEFTPEYIAERACREELLDLAGMMTSPTQW